MLPAPSLAPHRPGSNPAGESSWLPPPPFARPLFAHKVPGGFPFPADNECDVVSINGDHNIPTVQTQTAAESGATRVLKLRKIEPEFLQRMFSMEDL